MPARPKKKKNRGRPTLPGKPVSLPPVEIESGKAKDEPPLLLPGDEFKECRSEADIEARNMATIGKEVLGDKWDVIDRFVEDEELVEAKEFLPAQKTGRGIKTRRYFDANKEEIDPETKRRIYLPAAELPNAPVNGGFEEVDRLIPVRTQEVFFQFLWDGDEDLAMKAAGITTKAYEQAKSDFPEFAGFIEQIKALSLMEAARSVKLLGTGGIRTSEVITMRQSNGKVKWQKTKDNVLPPDRESARMVLSRQDPTWNPKHDVLGGQGGGDLIVVVKNEMALNPEKKHVIDLDRLGRDVREDG